jgi:DNA gyrase subunit A
MENEEKEINNIQEESEEEARKETGSGISGVKDGIEGGIEDMEMGPVVKESFLDYAMSVIVARALPDARDGFKPVQRRIIYSMQSSGNTPDKPFKKSARIVGDVMGKYHPHGDSAIYGAMAHLAQDFATRYTLVEGHGNYGNQDGDEPAAMRYTEARLAKISVEMVKEINKNTVDFIDAYDGEGKEPEILPARIPNLIVNGSTGIAVGMATNIPSHNLYETITAVQELIKNPDLTPTDLMQYIKGPDFPGGGIILGKSGIRKYFETGSGSVVVRGKYELNEKGDRTSIIFTELPYMVNKKLLAKRIMNLVDEKKIEGIASVNDFSSHAVGTRFQIDLKKNANTEIVLNHLFKYTPLQSNFPVNMLALDEGAPRLLNMKQALEIFIKFQEKIVERRTRFDLEKAKARLHILDGLIIAHDNIDEVVNIIRNADTQEAADIQLQERFNLDSIQSKAILDMPLRRLPHLEINKIQDEINQLRADIERYNSILSNYDVLKQLILDELEETKNKFKDDRRTEIGEGEYTAEDEDLIADEEILIMLTKSGYVKRVSPSAFRTQNRGGIGVIGMETKEDDIVDVLVHSRTKTDVLFFTNFGKVYRLRGYEIPLGSRTSKGLPIVNIINLEKDEKVLSIISVDNYDENHYLLFATRNGIVKKTSTDQFENINRNGKIAITLLENDTLIDVKYTDGNAYISLASSKGKVCTFKEEDVRPTGRTSIGVKGINADGGVVVGVCTSQEGGNQIFTLSSNGYGKRSLVSDFRVTSRGSKGVYAIKVSEKAGDLVCIKAVKESDEIIIVTDGGTVLKTRLADIHEANRQTIGVKVITLKEGENISSVSISESEQELEKAAENFVEVPQVESKDDSSDLENYVNNQGNDSEQE